MPPFTREQLAERNRSTKRSTIPPSPYQQAIIDWMNNSTGNALVDAKAGSGKTSTLCMLADEIPTFGSRAAFLAFNKAIADELKTRLPSHVQAATFHSVCMGALRRHPDCAQFAQDRNWVQSRKVDRILDTISGSYSDTEMYRRGVRQLVGLMKANAMLPEVDESELLALVNKYEIEFDDSEQDGGLQQGCDMARAVLHINNTDLSVIDFDDMLYLCWLLDVAMPKFSHLFVDEAQDTNPMQRVLMSRMLRTDGRLIAVGDPYQAIYGFRGADSEAMNMIETEFSCVRLPLSISYRCPRKVVAMAKRIVPDIEARENAPEGCVKQLDTVNLADFTTQDLVVCRNNAPLVSLAFKFLVAHKPVRIMGRDFGEQLVQLIQKMKATNLEDLEQKLNDYTDKEIAKATAKRNESKVERLNDQRDSINAIIYGMPEDSLTVDAVLDVIRRLFTESGGTNRTTLSSIHRAKGMEAHTVYILDGHLMPSKYATQPWQLVQEQNLKYVAVTRSLDSLYFINSQNIK